MNYNSAYLWEKGSGEAFSSISLVLQHAVVRHKQVMLVCICESGVPNECGVTESGYFTEGLVEWFHKTFLKLCERKGKEEDTERLLRREVERLKGEVQGFVQRKGMMSLLHFAGMLFWENLFWAFGQGDCQMYLLNRRFNRKQIKRINEEWEQDTYFSGKIQRKVGILFCTSGYLQAMKTEDVLEVLSMDGEITEERMQRRLTELRKEVIYRGEETSVGAVYVHT